MKITRYHRYEISIFDNKQWVKIFHHDVGNNTLFDKNKEIALQQLIYTKSQHIFSVLGFIDSSFKINSKYNFLIRYETELPNDFYYFNQSNFPLYAKIPEGVSKNFIHPGCLTQENHPTTIFDGLSISGQPSTYLDGNINETHHFSIGCNGFYYNKHQIPGPYCTQSSIGFTSVDIWLEFLETKTLNKLPFNEKCSFVANYYCKIFNKKFILFICILD